VDPAGDVPEQQQQQGALLPVPAAQQQQTYQVVPATQGQRQVGALALLQSHPAVHLEAPLHLAACVKAAHIRSQR
jgi:hypothetical protein